LEEDMANSESEMAKFDAAIDSLLNSSGKAVDKYGVDFTEAILDSVANGSQEFDFSSLFSELDVKESEEILGMSPEEILNMVGLSEE
jgi:hypothetical protein